jgi:hypothetical protein
MIENVERLKKRGAKIHSEDSFRGHPVTSIEKPGGLAKGGL